MNLEDPSTIEEKVGALRRYAVHMGRMNSEDEVFYILHSGLCTEEFEDLRNCPFSHVFDKRGLDFPAWKGYEDRPVPLSATVRGLVPARLFHV